MKAEIEKRLDKLETQQARQGQKTGVFFEELPGQPGKTWAVLYWQDRPVKAWSMELWGLT